MDRWIPSLILLFAIVTPIFNLSYQMQPLKAAARNNTSPPQYSLLDVLILFAMLGLTGSLIFELSSRQTNVWVLASVWFPLIVYWLYSVRWLSRAGVASFPRRLAVEAVGMPIGTFGLLIVILTFVAIRIHGSRLSEDPHGPLFLYIFDWPRIELTRSEAKSVENWINLARVVFTFAWFFVPRWIARWAATPAIQGKA